MNKAKLSALVERVENFIKDYVTFEEDSTALVLALWVIATHFFQLFDAFGYIVITSATKRSGKTRLGEIMAAVAKAPQQLAAMTPAALFRTIEDLSPTLFIDEAECLSGESASVMRAVLNVGYRQGSKIARNVGNAVVQFSTYCPKVFILIGDVYDTLRDRSIVVMMRRSEARELKRFSFAEVNIEGESLRREILESLRDLKNDIQEVYSQVSTDWLSDRDAEIWKPIFTMCLLLCPGRLTELQRVSVDMSAEKTAEKRRYTELANAEEKSRDDEYARRLLRDVREVIGHEACVPSEIILQRLLDLNTAPWRKFRGDGLNLRMMATMLSRFGIRPTTIRTKGGRKNSIVRKGYKSKRVNREQVSVTPLQKKQRARSPVGSERALRVIRPCQRWSHPPTASGV